MYTFILIIYEYIRILIKQSGKKKYYRRTILKSKSNLELNEEKLKKTMSTKVLAEGSAENRKQKRNNFSFYLHFK